MVPNADVEYLPVAATQIYVNGAKGRVGVFGGAIIWDFVPFKASTMMIKNK